MSEAEPTLPELIRRAIESRIMDLHVAMPGIVVDYDPATKTATVKPALRRAIYTQDDDRTAEDIPPIPNVPVVFPGAAALDLHFNLAAGDTVLMVFNQWSPTEWRTSGAVATPGDMRLHGLGYPVALAGYRHNQNAAPDTDESIGKPGGLRLHFKTDTIEAGAGDDFVSLAAKVDHNFDQLKTAFAAWSPNPGDGGLALKTILATLFADITPLWLPSTASKDLKASNP